MDDEQGSGLIWAIKDEIKKAEKGNSFSILNGTALKPFAFSLVAKNFSFAFSVIL